MGFYSQVIIPWFLDWAMDREVLNCRRRELLSHAQGNILEIGFGTGVNLPFYPSGVKAITTVDPNHGMNLRARKRIDVSPIHVETHLLPAETLPMTGNSFDTVVSTMTLCSISDVSRALREVYRVLKPGGHFLFLEHGVSPDRKVKIWQDRLTPVSRIVGDGCHLNRDIRKLVEGVAFKINHITNFYLEETPKIAGYMYKGMAQKA